MALLGIRKRFWMLIGIFTSYCVYLRLETLSEEWRRAGWEFVPGVGWVDGSEKFEAPDRFYDTLQISPSADPGFVKRTCRLKIGRLVLQPSRSSAEASELKQIEKACAALTVDHKRCLYDAGHGHCDGLWEGYYAPCFYLEWLAESEPNLKIKIARQEANLKRQGIYTDRLLNDYIIKAKEILLKDKETRSRWAEEQLVTQKIERLQKVEKEAEKMLQDQLEKRQPKTQQDGNRS